MKDCTLKASDFSVIQPFPFHIRKVVHLLLVLQEAAPRAVLLPAAFVEFLPPDAGIGVGDKAFHESHVRWLVFNALGLELPPCVGFEVADFGADGPCRVAPPVVEEDFVENKLAVVSATIDRCV